MRFFGRTAHLANGTEARRAIFPAQIAVALGTQRHMHACSRVSVAPRHTHTRQHDDAINNSQGSITMQRSRSLHATHVNMASPDSLSPSDESSSGVSGRGRRNDNMPDCAMMRPRRLSCALEMHRRNSKKSNPPF